MRCPRHAEDRRGKVPEPTAKSNRTASSEDSSVNSCAPRAAWCASHVQGVRGAHKNVPLYVLGDRPYWLYFDLEYSKGTATANEFAAQQGSMGGRSSHRPAR